MENGEIIMVEEQSNRNMNIPFILRIVGIIALLITVISLSTGLYKMFVYESPFIEDEIMYEEDMYDEEKGVNSYNYMNGQDYAINAGLATAYFTLSILFTIIGIGSFVLAELLKRSERMEEKDPTLSR